MPTSCNKFEVSCELGRLLYQLDGVRILGISKDLIGFAYLKQAAVAHHADAVANLANNG